MYIILKQKILKYSKEISKVVTIIIIGFLLILAMIFIKYKPAYEITIAEEQLGYIQNKEEFKNLLNELTLIKETNVADISLNNEPIYKVKLIARNIQTNQDEILNQIKQNYLTTTYRYYEVALNDITRAYVDTLEEAESIVNQIEEEFGGEDLELDLKINEGFTQNLNEIKIASLEDASNTVETAALEIKEDSETIAIVNDIKLSVLPVEGRITSRYGESSSLRRSIHTGLDIACTTGTEIKVVSEGTVTFAAYNGSYGNLVKVDHGNGVETWYGHCSKIYAKVGDSVIAGDVIAAVGSTGNSTGPHLHFEIRIDGDTVNPRNYVY